MMPSYQLTASLQINGNLLKYQQMAKFSSCDLQEWLYGSESIQFKNKMFEILRNDNVFVRDWRILTMNESRQICNQRWKQLLNYNFIKFDGLNASLEINGNLLKYQQMAKFSSCDLQEWLYGSESIQFKNKIFEILRNDNVFVRDWRILTMNESRQICNQRWKQLLNYNFIKFDGLKTNSERFVDFTEVLESYDQSLATKFYINAIFYITILSMGTNRHQQILEKCMNNEIVGCFCLTELSHGSDVNSIRTECHYDKGQFVMHTPDDEAMKCWAGNLD
ncbi:unnamed protein product [Brugia pahangi]|uniref:Acyl-coenzyme A oxidase n=1 Tax=Brugia pahangi TaxID=6280 RepID=A0A0N4TYI7_BRUPA|nr:unnamed protein product [Brugia pahangi]